jgi:hypothetical protein
MYEQIYNLDRHLGYFLNSCNGQDPGHPIYVLDEPWKVFTAILLISLITGWNLYKSYSGRKSEYKNIDISDII